MNELLWVPGTRDALTVSAAWHGQGDAELVWGDGARSQVRSGQPVEHTYPQAGAYRLTARPAGRASGRPDGQDQVVSCQVVVRDSTVPGVRLTPRHDNPNLYELAFAERERELISWYRVVWGDDSAPLEIAGSAGTSVTHAYRDGHYDVAVQDTGTRRWWRQSLTVAAPAQDPDIALAFPDPVGDPRRVRATLKTAQPGKAAGLDWGDGSDPDELAAPGDTADHTYAADGIYIVQGYYTDGSGDGAAWDLTVPQKARVTRPASELLVRPDSVDPLTVWIKWAGSGSDYDIHFGDGARTRRAWWQPPVKHTYAGFGRYRVHATSDNGDEVAEWVELAEPAPLPQRPAPVFVVHPQGSGLRVWVRLLFRPPTMADPVDHRQAPHEIDWGDGTRESVGAGVPYVDHDYLPGRWAWPADRPFPVVVVTDTETGRQARQTVDAVRPPRTWAAWESEAPQGPVFETMASQLPTVGPDTEYQVWSAGQLVHQQAPREGTAYFYWTQTWPMAGWASASLVTMDGRELHANPLWHQREQGLCAYDWDWRGDPRLILCTPWLFGTSTGPTVGEFQVDWGDGATREALPAPDGPEMQRARDVLASPGANPTLPHFYERYGTYTLAVTPDNGVPPSSRRVGPCLVSLVDSGHPAEMRLDFVLQDAWHPVRVDWGDGTPVTRQHPAGDRTDGRGSLIHRYAAPGTYEVTVYAPMQDPIKFRRVVRGVDTMREHNMSFKAVYTPSTQWWGGYSATYRVTNEGSSPGTWELSFHLQEPSRVVDVWGAGAPKMVGDRQHKPGRPGESTEPEMALYREPKDGDSDMRTYVLRCTKPLAAGQTVDVGMRVESGQQHVAEPQSCSINGGPCTGVVTPPENDTEPPTVPTDVRVVSTGPKTVSLAWTESTDDTGVRAYEVAVDGDVAQKVPAPAASGTVTGLDPETEYELTVRAVDMAGNRSLWSEPVTGKTAARPPQSDKAWQATVAPFVDMGLWPTPQLADFAQESGLKAFNLGFITSPSAATCEAVWAGQPTYAVKDGWQKDNIRAFNAAEGQTAVVSFGGEAGVELAQAAADVDTVYAQYKLVIDTYGLTHIDFDIEGGAQRDQPANERRAAAVARLQHEYPDLRVSWTLPVLPEGLVADGLGVLRTAFNAGVRIDLVNIMSMVFYRPEDMGELVRQSADATHGQLAEFFPGMSAKKRWEKLSVCPMIGMNNDRAVFSLKHAEELAAYAQEKGLGQLTYWEAGRDRNACMSQSLYQCTAVPQEPWDYAARLRPFQDAAKRAGK